MKYKPIILILLTSLISCSQINVKEHPEFQYFPKISLLSKGLVWKYYYHTTRNKGQTKTDIRYIKKTLDGNTFINTEFNAEFKKVNSSIVSINNDKWILKEARRFEHRNSFTDLSIESIEVIQDSIATDWVNDRALLTQSNLEDGNGRTLITDPLQHNDILIDNVKAHLINEERQFIRIEDDVSQDTISPNWIRRYEKGLGLTNSRFFNDQYIF